MRCPLCKGQMKKGKSLLPFQISKEKIVVITDVPALICHQCGDSFHDLNISKQVEKMVSLAKKDGMKMGFLTFSRAA